MTLNERLDSMDDGDYVRVAARGGAHFVFAGTVADVRKAEPDETERSFRVTEKRYSKDLTDYRKVKNEYDKIKARLDKLETLIIRQKGKLMVSKEAYEDFKAFGDREVIDDFTAAEIIDDVGPVRVLYVKGVETGKYQKIGDDGKGTGMS